MTPRDLQKGTGDVGASRPASLGGKSMAVRSIGDEPSIQELIEARDRADGGVRLAMPSLFDGLGGAAEREPLDPEVAAAVVADLATMREEGIAAMKQLDRCRDQDGAADLHVRVGRIVNGIDDLSALLVERWGS